ncbi:hypothetical protein [Defluviicoccus vanus]|uniref:Lipoprotein n=1 Tax=Defluviicoccus vanus TaxID=111831 RepID=A0A7H1N3W9_9PROT|nr:hypothetical protein [Defluviicoccus vanus]QNT70405.1 hypothetical protein HQ394_15070 [Defluviicoccus vanus]
MQKTLLVVALSAVLSACATDPIILTNSATGATVDCGSRSWWADWWGVMNARKEKQCVDMYRADGYHL